MIHPLGTMHHPFIAIYPVAAEAFHKKAKKVPLLWWKNNDDLPGS